MGKTEAEVVDRGKAVGDATEDVVARSTLAWMAAIASLGTQSLSFNCISVWVRLSTVVGLCHCAAVDEAAVVAAVAAFAAAESPDVAEVVAKWPTAIFCMASLKRPTGKYQCPLVPFSIWR